MTSDNGTLTILARNTSDGTRKMVSVESLDVLDLERLYV